MNEVCDIWSSPWRTLQRQLAKDAKTSAGSAVRLHRVCDPTTWLGRALNRTAPMAESRSVL
jgi:hypothetical protein